MISLNKDDPPSNANEKPSNKNDLINKLQNLLDVIHNDPIYYNGSFHKDTNLVEVLNAIDVILFKDNNTSVHLIVEKKANNSMDMTIDLIK